MTGQELKTAPADYLLKFKKDDSELDENAIIKRNLAVMTLALGRAPVKNAEV